ncbi:hypothetical protein EWE75_24000 [Sphingomonas populi]|uniref:Uncharacterized protein n=1 Tax=Sphingomonas populi TaxID=2484750 RepID=A0A4Q6XRD0_9SPHN|nr:hypothetical protein [Sphingomonas populi]RZF59037.1 hypothetical protein EWE75_24000 [Sphingomonas populi]
MDPQIKDWLPPVIGLAGGLVAGLIAAMSAVIGKENKISEFRQAWIDAQRIDLATLTAEAVAYAGEIESSKKVERLAAFDAAHARIELRENPEEEEWTAVRAELDALREDMLKPVPETVALRDRRMTILEAARLPLKANWTIVKTGEPWFRRFKNAIIVAIVAAVTIGVTVALWLGPTGLSMRPAASVVAPEPATALGADKTALPRSVPHRP